MWKEKEDRYEYVTKYLRRGLTKDVSKFKKEDGGGDIESGCVIVRFRALDQRNGDENDKEEVWE